MSGHQPARTLAILLGASEFPNSPGLAEGRAFTMSCADIRFYLSSKDGLGLPRQNVFSLFDDFRSPSDQLIELSNFLRKRKAELDGANESPVQLLIYYVGHGLFTRGDQAYCLAVRCTNEFNEGVTSIRARDLVEAVRGSAAFLRNYWILDCCFAASILKELQSGALNAVRIQILGETPVRGAAILCSSSSRDTSLAPSGLEHTMFSDALIRSLRTGHQDAGPYLSFSELGDLVTETLRSRWPDRWVRPEIHSPDRREGDIAGVPLFPNPSYRTVTPVPSEVSEGTVTPVPSEVSEEGLEIHQHFTVQHDIATQKQQAGRDRDAAQNDSAELARQHEEQRLAAFERAAQMMVREAAQEKAAQQRLASEKAEVERRRSERVEQELITSANNQVLRTQATREQEAAQNRTSKHRLWALMLWCVLILSLLAVNALTFWVGRELAQHIASDNKGWMPTVVNVIITWLISSLLGWGIGKITKFFEAPSGFLSSFVWPGFLIGFRFFSNLPVDTQPSIWYAVLGSILMVGGSLVAADD